MKHLLLLAISTTLLTLGTSAQQRMSNTERAQQITKQMTRELKLDSKQQKKVEKIYTTYFDAMQASRPTMQRPPMGGPNGGGERGGMRGGMPRGERPNMEGGQRPHMNGQRPPMGERPDMEATQKEMDKAIEKRNKSMQKVLTHEQYSRWQKIERERMTRDFNRMENRQGERGQRQEQRPQPHRNNR